MLPKITTTAAMQTKDNTSAMQHKLQYNTGVVMQGNVT